MTLSCNGPRRVLVIDDCADTTESLAWLLSAAGFHVVQATTAHEGLAQAQRFQPDAVLLDLSLGGAVSGLDLARAMRGGRVTPTARIAAMTGWSGDAHRRAAADAGFDAYFVKPADLEELGRFIRGDDVGDGCRPLQRAARGEALASTL